jgi:hypothetical protein
VQQIELSALWLPDLLPEAKLIGWFRNLLQKSQTEQR